MITIRFFNRIFILVLRWDEPHVRAALTVLISGGYWLVYGFGQCYLGIKRPRELLNIEHNGVKLIRIPNLFTLVYRGLCHLVDNCIYFLTPYYTDVLMTLSQIYLPNSRVDDKIRKFRAEYWLLRREGAEPYQIIDFIRENR